MANTFTQIYLQFVFAVQDRASLIQTNWKDELYKYITGIVQKNKHKLIAIKGMPNHLHLFIGYKPHQSIPDLLQDIKGSSSAWINNRGAYKWEVFMAGRLWCIFLFSFAYRQCCEIHNESGATS